MVALTDQDGTRGGAVADAVTPPRRRAAPAVLWLVIAIVILAIVVFLSLALGARDVSLGTVIQALVDPDSGSTDHTVIRELRFPRTVIGLFAGLALGMAGGLMQGLTRNPLADPGLLGVNAGASLAVVISIAFFGVGSASGYIWFAMAGAAVAAVAVYAIGSGGLSRLGRRGGGRGSGGENGAGPSPITLALAGAALTAALTSLINLLLLSDVDTFAQFRFWSVGSLVGRDLDTAVTLLPFLAVGVGLAFVAARMLNLVSMGEDTARSLGVSVGATRGLTAVAVVLLCGAATSLAGPIVFVGLVVPHIARKLVGIDYRWVLALSAVLGAILLVAADVIGRFVVPPGELEAGIVVALLGAPLMIAIVRRPGLVRL